MHTATWGKFASGKESLLVYGGVDQTGNALADFWHVDLVSTDFEYNNLGKPETYPVMFVTLRDVANISARDPNDIVADFKSILLTYAEKFDLQISLHGRGYYNNYQKELAELDLLDVYYVKDSDKWAIHGRQFWQYMCRHLNGEPFFGGLGDWCYRYRACAEGFFCDYENQWEWSEGQEMGFCQPCQVCQSEGKNCSSCGLPDLGAQACHDTCANPLLTCGETCRMWKESISSIQRSFKTRVFAGAQVESCNIDDSVFDVALAQTQYNDTKSCNRSHVGNKCMRGMCIEKNTDGGPLYCYENSGLTLGVKPCYDNNGLMVTSGTCTLPGPRHGHSAASFHIQDTVVYSMFGGESTHLTQAFKSLVSNDVHIALFEGKTAFKSDSTGETNGKLTCQGACEGSVTWNKLWTTCDDPQGRSGPICPEKRRDAAVSVMSNNPGNNGRLLIFGGMGGASEDPKSPLYYKLGMKSYLNKQVSTKFKAFDDLWYV
jgi:hypothetical protein